MRPSPPFLDVAVLGDLRATLITILRFLPSCDDDTGQSSLFPYRPLFPGKSDYANSAPLGLRLNVLMHGRRSFTPPPLVSITFFVTPPSYRESPRREFPSPYPDTFSSPLIFFFSPARAVPHPFHFFLSSGPPPLRESFLIYFVSLFH